MYNAGVLQFDLVSNLKGKKNTTLQSGTIFQSFTMTIHGELSQHKRSEKPVWPLRISPMNEHMVID